MQQPNILFYFSDQQRHDTVGVYNPRLKITPNLDRMASEGVLFENAFTNQPVCGPTRAVLQTGRYATEMGTYQNDISLPIDQKTIAHHLKAGGYEVGYIGKWHLASNGKHFRDDLPEYDNEVINVQRNAVPPERRGGYDDYWLASDVLEFTSHSYDGHMYDIQGNPVEFPEGKYRVDAQTDWVLEYLRTRSGEKPFFLFNSYIEPHHQNDHNHFEGPEGSKERFAKYPVPGDLKGTGGDWRSEYPDYLGCINSLDENLGRVRDELERLGLADNTLIVYTSDHACHFRTRNAEYKRSCHENSIRIPMVIHGPGFTGGKVVKDLVSLIDLPKTLLNSAGVDIPEKMRGSDLKPFVTGQGESEEVFVQISEDHIGRALRTSRYKYSVKAADGHATKGCSQKYVEDFLYDLEADPHERDNLVRSEQHRNIRTYLADRLKAWISEIEEMQVEIQAS